MMDREKVIKGLECCTTQGFGCIENKKCPYGAQRYGSHCVDSMLRDAIALLKAQEPRVMTLEEVLATEVVYAEDIDKADIIPVIVNRRAHDRIVLVRAHLMGGPSHEIYPLICEYGKRWRCWTSRPTDEHREVTPWN